MKIVIEYETDEQVIRKTYRPRPEESANEFANRIGAEVHHVVRINESENANRSTNSPSDKP